MLVKPFRCPFHGCRSPRIKVFFKKPSATSDVPTHCPGGYELPQVAPGGMGLKCRMCDKTSELSELSDSIYMYIHAKWFLYSTYDSMLRFVDQISYTYLTFFPRHI